MISQLGVLDDHLGDDGRHLVENQLQLVLVPVQILHHAGGAAEVVGNDVVGRGGHAAVEERKPGGIEALHPVDVVGEKRVRLLGRGNDLLERGTHFRQGEGAHGVHRTQVVHAGELRQLVEALKHAHHARQVFLQVEAGGIEEEVVVLLRLHVLTVEVLERLHVANAVSRPLQLLEVELLQHGSDGGAEDQRIDTVRLEFHRRVERHFLRQIVVVHHLLVGDAAILGGPEEAVQADRHAVRLFEAGAGLDSLPARIVGGLGSVALLVGSDHRSHYAATPVQPRQRLTASTALTPKASAPV